MLDILDSRSGRREFLKIGGLSLGGMTLPGLLAAKSAAASLGLPVRDKSVIFVFMHGGPSQVETFDPKMTAPAGIASATGELSTTIPGITFGGTFPRLAELAKRMTIVRSFHTGNGAHDIKPIVGKATHGANLGSMYSRVVGQNRRDNGLPTNVALYPRAVDDSTMPAIKQFGDFEATGTLGVSAAPFVPSAGSNMRENMQLKLPLGRVDDRRQLLSGLDRLKRRAESAGGLDGIDSFRRQAFETILGGAADAFDLSKEDPDTVRSYDTAPLVRPDQIARHWNNYKRYVDNAKSLGKLLLLARRLCERGVGFVTLTTNFVWDMHSDVNNAGVEEGMRYMGVPFDHAVSAFLKDVEARGLSDRILLVCCGEMGRTPKINARGGRDHWGRLAPLMIAGGGLPMGQVIGQSTRDAAQPLSEPIGTGRLVSTVLHTLLDVGELRLMPGVPREVIQAAAVPPIPGMV